LVLLNISSFSQYGFLPFPDTADMWHLVFLVGFSFSCHVKQLAINGIFVFLCDYIFGLL